MCPEHFSLFIMVFLMSFDCKCSVALPHGAVGLHCVFMVFSDHTHLLFGTKRPIYIFQANFIESNNCRSTLVDFELTI